MFQKDNTNNKTLFFIFIISVPFYYSSGITAVCDKIIAFKNSLLYSVSPGFAEYDAFLGIGMISYPKSSAFFKNKYISSGTTNKNTAGSAVESPFSNTWFPSLSLTSSTSIDEISFPKITLSLSSFIDWT